jgi:hypothetical protein
MGYDNNLKSHVESVPQALHVLEDPNLSRLSHQCQKIKMVSARIARLQHTNLGRGTHGRSGSQEQLVWFVQQMMRCSERWKQAIKKLNRLYTRPSVRHQDMDLTRIGKVNGQATDVENSKPSRYSTRW